MVQHLLAVASLNMTDTLSDDTGNDELPARKAADVSASWAVTEDITIKMIGFENDV